MLKKGLAWTMAAIMMFSLAACQGGSTTGSETTAAQTKAEVRETESEGTDTSEEKHEPVTITMWWPGSGEGYEQLAKGFADLVHETYDWITIDYPGQCRPQRPHSSWNHNLPKEPPDNRW